MVLFFPRKARAVLGLDLSAAAVRMLALGRAGPRLTVQGVGLAPLMPNAILGHTIQHSADVVAAIQDALGQMQSNLRHVAIAMPATGIISKTLQLQAEFCNEALEAHIQLEAATSIPFPLDEVCMDFFVLGPNAINPDKVDVVWVAARKMEVDARIAVAEEAGLIVDYVDVDMFALERAVNDLEKQDIHKTIAVVDVETTTIRLTVIQQRRAVYTQEEVLGAQQAIEGVQALAPLLRRAMQLFVSTEKSAPVDKIILTGRGATAEGLQSMMVDCFSLPVSVAAPFQNKALAAGMNREGLDEVSPALMWAFGLALKGCVHYDTH